MNPLLTILVYLFVFSTLFKTNMLRYTRQLWETVDERTRAGAIRCAGLGVEAQTSMLDDALHGIGLDMRLTFAGAFGRTQDEAVAAVLNGHIYAGKRAGLSRRIWNNEALLNGQIEQIIATAVAEGRSAIQLGKDLEAYVNPEARMPDHWNDIYPLPFHYAVDYNAKRLAVTALNHAHFQGMIMAARENPFAEFLHWELSSGHEIYDICDTYMEHDEGLGLGNFSLDNAPLPHPFCRCTYYIDSSKSLEEIGRELGSWLAGEENPRLEKAFGEWREQQAGDGWSRYGLDNRYAGYLKDRPDEAMLSSVRGAVDRVMAEFPELEEHLETVAFVPEEGIGATRIDGRVIRLSNTAFRNMETLQKVFDQSVQDGQTVGAVNPMYIVAHECGHALEAIAVEKQLGHRIRNDRDKAQFTHMQWETGVEYFLHAGFQDETKEEIYAIIKKELGRRAAYSPAEMMAQAVATHFYGTASSSVAEHLVEHLKNLLRR